MQQTFEGIYNGKNVFVTGHTGFKGSWLALWLTRLGANVTGYSRAPNTDPDHFSLLKLDMRSVIGELLDIDLLTKTMQAAAPEIVFHLAAQPLVRDSYDDPVETYNSNVIGSLHVCEAARRCPSVRAVVAITTDKVYENYEWERGYREDDRLGGYDPYSSSKACAEILYSSYRNSFWNVAEYGKSHDVLLTAVRAGNVIGGGDWSKDRLIPDIVKATAKGERTVIRNPSATRPWQHVLECLSGYLLVGSRLLKGEKQFASAFNFGPPDTDELPVRAVCDMVSRHWPKADFEYPQLSGQPHEAGLLKLDCAKAHAQLQWQPMWESETAIAKTVDWYRNYYQDGAVGSSDDLEEYVSLAKQRGAVWA